MTLNGVTALISRYFTEFDSFAAGYVTVVEDRPMTVVLGFDAVRLICISVVKQYYTIQQLFTVHMLRSPYVCSNVLGRVIHSSKRSVLYQESGRR